jgi:hypothetical protein
MWFFVTLSMTIMVIKNAITSKPCFVSEQNVAYERRVQGTLLLHPLAEVSSGREVCSTETLYALEVVGYSGWRCKIRHTLLRLSTRSCAAILVEVPGDCATLCNTLSSTSGVGFLAYLLVLHVQSSHVL